MNASGLTKRWSQRPPASRPHFAWLKPFHFGRRAVPVAVAQLFLVRCMRSRKYGFPLAVFLTVLVANASAGEPRHITFSELVASPRQFDGRRVSVQDITKPTMKAAICLLTQPRRRPDSATLSGSSSGRGSGITSITNGRARLVGFNERKDNDQGRFKTALQGIVCKGLRYAKLIAAEGGDGPCPETWQTV